MTRTLTIALVLAAAVTAAAFYAGWSRHRSGEQSTPAAPPPPAANAASYVGSAACSGCHADQDRAWQGSQHAQAMQARDRYHGAGRFQRRTVRSQGGEIGVLPAGRQVHRPHRRTGRAPRRFRGASYLRHLPSAAVPGRASGRPAAGACRSPGTPGRSSQGGSAGFTSIRMNGSIIATSCTGPGASRTGTSCAPIAIRPTCRRTTTPSPIAMPRAGARSASAARPVTARDRSTHVSRPRAAAPKD